MKRLLGFGVVALALAGCGGAKVTVSSRVGNKSPTALTAASPSGQLTLNGGNIGLDDVKIVVRRIRLEPTPAATGASSEGEDEIGVGPFLVEFKKAYLDSINGTGPTGNMLQQVLKANVTPAVYKQIKFEIHKVEDADLASNPGLSDMKTLSVRITGTCSFAGCSCPTPPNSTVRTFTFESALDEEQEREGTFDLTNGGGNIDFNIDPTGWFTDPSNAALTLDPCSATNQSKIESNIKASIDLYDDDNMDGLPDHP